MTKIPIYEISQNFSLLKYYDVDLWNNYIDQYPYFSAAHILLAKKLKDENHPDYDEYITKVAAYSNNRLRLYDIINRKTAENLGIDITQEISDINSLIENEQAFVEEEKTLNQDAKVKQKEALETIKKQYITHSMQSEIQWAYIHTICYEPELTVTETMQVLVPEFPPSINILEEIKIENETPLEYQFLKQDEPISEVNINDENFIVIHEKSSSSLELPSEEIAQDIKEFSNNTVTETEMLESKVNNDEVPKTAEPIIDFAYVTMDYTTLLQSETKQSIEELNETKLNESNTFGTRQSFLHWLHGYKSNQVKKVSSASQRIKKIGGQATKIDTKAGIEKTDHWVRNLDHYSKDNVMLSEAENKKIIAEAAESLHIQKGVISETLAKIYIEQGNMTKARKMYENLMLLYPEKSAIFAAALESLRKK